jgi:hypothetical protein
MKKLLSLTAILTIAITSIYAQSNKEQVEFFQSIFGMEKKALVTEFVSLEGEASTAFWTLYDEYETTRKANGQRRITLIDKYANSYMDLDAVTTDELVAESMKIQEAQYKLIKSYYKKIKKVSGSKAAAQFYQLELFIQDATGVALMEQIPFIGEFDL